MRERIALIFFKVLPAFIIQDHEFLGKLITETPPLTFSKAAASQ